MARAHDTDKNGFWADKVPCWVIRGCPVDSRRLCGAYVDQSRPCWEHEDTLSKRLLGLDTCFICRVFERYGYAERVCGNGNDGARMGQPDL